MNKKPYSYAGTALNDGTNFESYIPEGQTILSSGTPNWARQKSTYPYLSGTSLAGGTITIVVICKGTLHSQQETLKKLFDINVQSANNFIVQDTEDSNRQWYVSAYPLSIQRIEASGSYEVTLALISPVWLTVAETTESAWSVASTGSTKAITIDKGNLSAYPVISISPNAGRNAGFLYRRFVKTYNRTRVQAGSYPIDITAGGLNTSVLVADTSQSNQINLVGGITAVATTIPIDTPVGGGLPNSGMGYLDTEQISWTGNSAGNLTGVTRGIGGTTAATHADNTVINFSHMLANGGDIRVKVGTTAGNMTLSNYWLSTTSLAAATALKIWVPITYTEQTYANVSPSISDVQTTMKHTNALFTPTYPRAGGTLLVESEIMTYTAYNPSTKTFSGLVRGAFDSTAAAHSAGVAIYIIPAITLYYGDYSLIAPTATNTHKPTFSLTSSTNSSWVFTSFWGSTQPTWSWKYSSNNSIVRMYTVDRALNSGITEQAAEIGIGLFTTTHQGEWNFTCPFGFTLATFTDVDRFNVPQSVTGVSYATIKSWYTNPAIITETNIAVTTVAATWQTTASLVHTPSVTHRTVQFFMRNPSTTLPYYVAVNIAGVTLALSTATTSQTEGVPSVTLGSEVAIEYSAEATITNNTTGDAIYLNTDIPFGQSVEIDTLNKTVIQKWNNQLAYSDFGLSSVRDEWLKLTQGSNTLQYDEVGASNLTITVKWRGRNN